MLAGRPTRAGPHKELRTKHGETCSCEKPLLMPPSANLFTYTPSLIVSRQRRDCKWHRPKLQLTVKERWANGATCFPSEEKRPMTSKSFQIKRLVTQAVCSCKHLWAISQNNKTQSFTFRQESCPPWLSPASADPSFTRHTYILLPFCISLSRLHLNCMLGQEGKHLLLIRYDSCFSSCLPDGVGDMERGRTIYRPTDHFTMQTCCLLWASRSSSVKAVNGCEDL